MQNVSTIEDTVIKLVLLHFGLELPVLCLQRDYAKNYSTDLHKDISKGVRQRAEKLD